MAAHLLLAPTGRGKTGYVLERVQAAREGTPLAAVWIVLPNRIQVRAFGQRLAAAGGALGVELGTFHYFYGEILARSGRPAARLRDTVLHRLLLRLLDQQIRAGQVQHYAPLRGRPGFARLLRELFQELKQARIEPQALDGALAEAAPRLVELAGLYRAYQEWLIRSDWMDAEGQGWLAAETLAHGAGPDLRLLAVDGFDEFNPTQLAVLSLLADRAAETVITLTGDPACDDRLAHRRFCRARDALQAALGLDPQPLPNTQYPIPNTQYPISNTQSPIPNPAPLTHLEAALFQPTTIRLPAGDAITCLEAPTPAAEARAALRWLKGQLLCRGYRPDQVALLARDLEPYRPHLAEVADEFGLPLYVAGGRPLAGNPAVAALLNLLSLPAEGWPRRPLLDALACPYFDWSAAGLDAEAVRGLEAAARAGLVIAGLDQWREALERLAGSGAEEGAAADAADAEAVAVAERDAEGLPELPAGQRARQLWACLQAAAGRLSPPAHGTLREHVAFVEDLVGEDPKLASRFRTEAEAADDSLRVVARAWEAGDTAERDVAALRRFKDVLRGLVLADEVLLGPEEQAASLDYSQFYVELRGAVEGAHYELPLPPPGSAVLAAPLLYARGLSFAAVALVGLAEGQFPQREREDPLLNESDRETLRAAGLPLEPRLQGDEASLFYEAATRARLHLLLTRPYLAADGQAWEPSPYWDEVQHLVAAPVQRLRSQEPLPPAEIASPPEALLAAALGGAGGDAGLPGWQRVLAAAKVVRGREAPDPAGCPWDGALDAVAPELAERYGPRHVWSASRLETYATCPFQFFAGSVLGLEPRLPPAEGYDVRILGTMYHAILEETYRRALPEAKPEDLRALLPEVAAEVFAGAPDEYGFRPTALWERQRRELTAVLTETLEGLIEATAGWQVVAL
ncbi:MAG: PD-(D/E)XK nuclease family protein, partial [Anaerolineae bacterium]